MFQLMDEFGLELSKYWTIYNKIKPSFSKYKKEKEGLFLLWLIFLSLVEKKLILY